MESSLGSEEAAGSYHFHALKFWEEDAIVPLNVDYSLNEDCLEAVYKRYMVA